MSMVVKHATEACTSFHLGVTLSKQLLKGSLVCKLRILLWIFRYEVA